jgi:hypothetical protein
MPEKLEERVAHLESEVARLKNKVEKDLSFKPWWEQIAGTFADNSAYDEVMRLGREIVTLSAQALQSHPTNTSRCIFSIRIISAL